MERSDVKAALGAAEERAGLSDFGDDAFMEPLALACADLARTPLNDFGRAFIERQLGKELVRRLRIVDFLKRNPEVNDVELPPIVLITGHPRTGTTCCTT